jgi:hypothetical protein
MNNEIEKQRKYEGRESLELRKQFYDTSERIKQLLSESPPLDEIRDPNVRNILKWVRDGNHYPLDIESKNLVELLRPLPFDVVKSLMEKKGIFVSEEEVEEFIAFKDQDFIREMMEISDSIEYFERKEEFSTIIADTRIDKKLFAYFDDIRMCYLFGRFRAVIGLCRVLLEIAFRDKFTRMGLGKRNQKSKIHEFEKYRIGEVIHLVCSKLGSRQLKSTALDLYSASSKVLHGSRVKMSLKSKDALSFVKQTFMILEKLYGIG